MRAHDLMHVSWTGLTTQAGAAARHLSSWPLYRRPQLSMHLLLFHSQAEDRSQVDASVTLPQLRLQMLPYWFHLHVESLAHIVCDVWRYSQRQMHVPFHWHIELVPQAVSDEISVHISSHTSRTLSYLQFRSPSQPARVWYLYMHLGSHVAAERATHRALAPHCAIEIDAQASTHWFAFGSYMHCESALQSVGDV